MVISARKTSGLWPSHQSTVCPDELDVMCAGSQASAVSWRPAHQPVRVAR
jgi:hypothetical protein